MSKQNYVEELEWGDSFGLDTTSNRKAIAPGFVREARNAEVEKGPGYRKRKGFTPQLTTLWGTRNIRQGFEYRASSGLHQTILFGTDDSIDGRVGFVSGGVVTDIRTGLSATDRPSFLQFGDRLMFFNGDTTGSPFLWDGTTDRNIGYAGPVAAPSALTPANGSGLLLSLAQYKYSYSYIRRISGRLIAESTPSPLGSVTLGASDNEVAMTLVASTEAGVTGIRIYRTAADGLTLFLAEEIGNITSHTDRIADAALTTQIELDNSRISDLTSTAQFPIIAQNRVFVISDDNEGRHSKLGQEGPLPESFEVKAVYDTQGTHGGGDVVVGQGKVSDTPIIIKERSIGRLDVIGVPQTAISSDTVGYKYVEIDSNVGGVSHWGGDEVFGEYVFINRDNIHATNGITVRAVGNSIRSTIRSLGWDSTRITRISTRVHREKKQIRFAVFKSETSLEPEMVIVGDYQQYPNFRWTTFEPGDDADTHPGIRAGSLFELSNSSNGSFELYFGNSDDRGQYYRMDDGNIDIYATTTEEEPIFFKIITRPYDMERPANIKLYKTMQLLAQGNDDNYFLEFCAIYDLNDIETQCADFTLPTFGGIWSTDAGVGDTWAFDDPNDDLSDALVWAGENLEILEYHAHKKAKHQELVFKQPDADAPVTIFGWQTSGTIFGAV